MRCSGVDDVVCALQQLLARGLGWGRGHGANRKALAAYREASGKGGIRTAPMRCAHASGVRWRASSQVRPSSWRPAAFLPTRYMVMAPSGNAFGSRKWCTLPSR